MRPTKRRFNCSIEMLYVITKLAWDFCSQHLTNFTAFRAKYTAQFVAAMLAAVEDAEGITNVSVRNAAAKKARIALEASVKILCDNWRELERYIINASEPADQQANVQAAGGDQYAKAAKGNWEAASTLIKSANSFITENLAFLQADDNMPAAFATLFDDNSTICSTKAKKYFDLDRKKLLTTADKAKANNEIYDAMIAMFADAQTIYKSKDNAGMARQFTFAYVVLLAGGSRPGGIKGGITDAITGKPVPGANITIVNENRQTQSGKKGRYELKKVAAGTYEVSVEAPFYQPYTTEVTVKAATTVRANIIIATTESTTLAAPNTQEPVENTSAPVTDISNHPTDITVPETAEDIKVA